jgi:hypothetical protein
VEEARQASGRSRRAASGSSATAVVLFVLTLALGVASVPLAGLAPAASGASS